MKTKEETVARYDMLSQGASMADELIQSHEITVVDGKDLHLDNYTVAVDFKIPE